MITHSSAMASSVSKSVFTSCVLFWLFIVSSISASVIIQHDLLARIEALEIQGREQAKTLIIQAEQMEQLESKLNKQNIQLSSQQQQIQHYEQKVDELERKVDDLTANIHEHVSKPTETGIINDGGQPIHAGRSQANSAIDKENIQKRILVESNTSPVAFNAVIKDYKWVTNITEGQKILFSDIMINLGGGYQNQSGIFTAPRPGLYLFSTSIMPNFKGDLEIAVRIVMNGNILAKAYAYGVPGKSDQGSVSVVTQLKAGDEVWASLDYPPVSSLFGYYFTSFMGVLIAPV